MATANSARLKRQVLRSVSTWIRPVTAISTTAARTGCGKGAQEPGEEHHHYERDERRHQAGKRGAGAGRFVDQRLRHAAAHRESGAEARGEIGGPERQEFLRGVESIAVLGGEHAPDRRGLDGREHEARHGQRQDLVDVRASDRGQRRHRQTLRHDAEQRHAAFVQVHHAGGDDAADHDEQRHGAVLQNGLAEQEEEKRDHTQRQGRRVGVAQAPEEVAHALPEIATVAAAESEQLRQLRAGQKQRHAALEADQHGFREEIDDGAGTDRVGHKRDRGDEQRRGGGERRVACRIAAGNLGERGADEQRDRRRDGDGRLARAAEQPERQPAKQARVKPRFRRQPGERRVAEAGRQQVRGQRDPRGHVWPQPRPFVPRQPGPRGNHHITRQAPR